MATFNTHESCDPGFEKVTREVHFENSWRLRINYVLRGAMIIPYMQYFCVFQIYSLVSLL